MNACLDKVTVSSPLFPRCGEQSDLETALVAALARSTERLAESPVAAVAELTQFRLDLADFDFESPRPLGEVLDWTVENLERGIVHVTHPSYFGLFNPAPTFPSVCADRIAAAFNPQLASSRTSPVPVDIEAHVIRAVAARAGLPPATAGHFTSGGSEANCTALLCALTAAAPGFARRGARAFSGQPVFYVSEDAHLAWFKIAHQVGIGRDGLRVIACDANGRLDLGRLRARCEEDRLEGCVPVMIVATAGTTNAGMVDPLAGCAAIARDYGAWLHVDAAWGGAVIASERLRGLIAGCETAQSLTIDAHKWFATTMGCGMFLTSRPDILAETFHVSAAFMPSSVVHLDPYINSAQWSRRFLGLRLFLSLAAAGWRGYAAHVEQCADLAGLFERSLRARGWRIANASSMALVLAEPPAGSPAANVLASSVVESGAAWLSSLEFRGAQVLRCCITNGRTTRRHVLDLVDALDRLTGLTRTSSLKRE